MAFGLQTDYGGFPEVLLLYKCYFTYDSPKVVLFSANGLHEMITNVNFNTYALRLTKWGGINLSWVFLRKFAPIIIRDIGTYDALALFVALS